MKGTGIKLLDEPHGHGDGTRGLQCHGPAGNAVQPLYHPAVSGQRFKGPG